MAGEGIGCAWGSAGWYALSVRFLGILCVYRGLGFQAGVFGIETVELQQLYVLYTKLYHSKFEVDRMVGLEVHVLLNIPGSESQICIHGVASNPYERERERYIFKASYFCSDLTIRSHIHLANQ